jgi:hypothetical protein
MNEITAEFEGDVYGRLADLEKTAKVMLETMERLAVAARLLLETARVLKENAERRQDANTTAN